MLHGGQGTVLARPSIPQNYGSVLGRSRFSAKLSARMIRRPTIAMGGFVSAISRNGCLFIARQNNIAGAVAHPGASDTPRRSAL